MTGSGVRGRILRPDLDRRLEEIKQAISGKHYEAARLLKLDLYESVLREIVRGCNENDEYVSPAYLAVNALKAA